MLRSAKVALAVFLTALCAFAQHRMAISRGCGAACATPAAMPPPITTGRRWSIQISGRPFGHRGGRRGFQGGSYLDGWPYLATGYYDYADFSNSYEPPPLAVEPAPPPPAPPQAVQESAPEPALLELQGNQWVRVASFKTAPSEGAGAFSKMLESKPVPPAVLVFRDGHREEVSSYSIIGPVLYTKADYWASGSWSREIRMADLDIAATRKENQERGVPFSLPAGPSEVVIRP